MNTVPLKQHYKTKCTRCGSWVNETDRYCPMCGYKAVEDFNPKFDNYSAEENFTQRLTPQGTLYKSKELNFIIPEMSYSFTVKVANNKFYIGSSPNCLIVVKRNYVSRFHATLDYNFDSEKLYIADNNSTNGTYVNNKKLSVGESVEIKENDIISLSESFKIKYLGLKT